MILFVKTTLDEDIVSEVEEVEGLEPGSIPAAGLTLKNPAKLMLTHQGLGMMPLNPFISEKTITLPKSVIVYTATPDDEIKSAYNQKFGSGLIVPTGSSLLIG